MTHLRWRFASHDVGCCVALTKAALKINQQGSNCRSCGRNMACIAGFESALLLFIVLLYLKDFIEPFCGTRTKESNSSNKRLGRLSLLGSADT